MRVIDSGIHVVSSELHFPHLPLALRDRFSRTGDLLKEVCEMIGRRSHCSDGPKAKKQQYVLHRTNFYYDRTRLSYCHTLGSVWLENKTLHDTSPLHRERKGEHWRRNRMGNEQKCTEHTWLPKVTGSQDFTFSPGITCDVPAGHNTRWYHQQGVIHHEALSFKRQNTSGSEPTLYFVA